MRQLSTSTRSEPKAVLASELSSSTPNAAAPNGGMPPIWQTPPPMLKPSKIAAGPRIDKSELPIGTERRFRDKSHLQLVAAQPCSVCARQHTHAHHLTFAQRRGLSMKVSDEYAVPSHHEELHRSGANRIGGGHVDPIRFQSRLSNGLNPGNSPPSPRSSPSSVNSTRV